MDNSVVLSKRSSNILGLSAESDKFICLDYLRIYACLLILWHHSHLFLSSPELRAGIANRSQALALGVDLFFVISGFFISFIFEGRNRSWLSLGEFYRRRVSRLYPVHILSLLVASACWIFVSVVTNQQVSGIDTSLGCFAKAVVLSHGVVPCDGGMAPNGVSWSVSVEVSLYLLFPIVLTIASTARKSILIFLVSFLAAVALAHYTKLEWDELPGLPRAFPSFVLGICLFRYRDSLGKISCPAALVPLLSVLVALLMQVGVHQLVVLMLVYILVASSVCVDARGERNALLYMVAPFGQLTYSIYMWHSIVTVFFLNALLDKVLGVAGGVMYLGFVISWAIVIAIALASYALVEVPARKFINDLGAGGGR